MLRLIINIVAVSLILLSMFTFVTEISLDNTQKFAILIVSLQLWILLKSDENKTRNRDTASKMAFRGFIRNSHDPDDIHRRTLTHTGNVD